MPTELDEARERVARLETEEKLVEAMEKAAAAADANPTPAKMAAHNRTQEELADYRQKIYSGGTQIGGDAVKDGV